MERLIGAIWRLALLVELSLYLGRLAAGHRAAHRPGRHAAPTALVVVTAEDREFLDWLEGLFERAGAGAAVAA